jgi:hypothetical protein
VDDRSPHKESGLDNKTARHRLSRLVRVLSLFGFSSGVAVLLCDMARAGFVTDLYSLVAYAFLEGSADEGGRAVTHLTQALDGMTATATVGLPTAWAAGHNDPVGFSCCDCVFVL